MDQFDFLWCPQNEKGPTQLAEHAIYFHVALLSLFSSIIVCEWSGQGAEASIPDSHGQTAADSDLSQSESTVLRAILAVSFWRVEIMRHSLAHTLLSDAGIGGSSFARGRAVATDPPGYRCRRRCSQFELQLRLISACEGWPKVFHGSRPGFLSQGKNVQVLDHF